QKLSRRQIEARLANTPPCLIGMEACVGAHHLSRQLKAYGHDARLMPARYVRPYSKGQKNSLVPIRPFLDDQTFDPETTRLMGVAFESARAAVKRPGDLTDEMIAKKIIELANAGERDVEVLGDAALNVPTGAVSAPNPPPLPASPPEPPGSSS